MIALLALLIAGIVALVRWIGGGSDDGGRRVRTARDVLDERYARGEIDREESISGVASDHRRLLVTSMGSGPDEIAPCLTSFLPTSS